MGDDAIHGAGYGTGLVVVTRLGSTAVRYRHEAKRQHTYRSEGLPAGRLAICEDDCVASVHRGSYETQVAALYTGLFSDPVRTASNLKLEVERPSPCYVEERAS